MTNFDTSDAERHSAALVWGTMRGQQSSMNGVLRTMRPRQWPKNLLVVAAPLAAGVVVESALAVAAALGAFVLVSSAIYLINDILDVDDDRKHPQKRHRPIAAGQVAVSTALVVAGVLLLAGLLVGFATNAGLGIVLGIYVVLQVLYSTVFKHQAVLDLAIVASGFLLRAIAGGLAAEVPLSQWFLLVAGFGSLFMVAGKRYSELLSLGNETGTRRTLVVYSDSYLRFVWSLAAAVTITAYSLWAFEISADNDTIWQAISIAPFVMGLLRYAVDIDRGEAGEPEEAVLHDHVLQAIGLVWVITFVLGVYLG